MCGSVVNETGSWVTDACTLPTAEQPLREAEFAELFARGVAHVDRLGPERVRLGLRPAAEVAAWAADLAARETGCCSFFTFGLTITAGAVELAIMVGRRHVEVLDALVAQARVAAGVTT